MNCKSYNIGIEMFCLIEKNMHNIKRVRRVKNENRARCNVCK